MQAAGDSCCRVQEGAQVAVIVQMCLDGEVLRSAGGHAFGYSGMPQKQMWLGEMCVTATAEYEYR